MISEVYDALKEAGASEDKARKAAEVLANYDARFNKIETDLAVLKWMVGFTLAGVVTLLFKAFA
ncbi:MAG: integrase [Deltaproteobacteria bacterium]|nr:integrase [Deltaproteobacteria bacterium]